MKEAPQKFLYVRLASADHTALKVAATRRGESIQQYVERLLRAALRREAAHVA